MKTKTPQKTPRSRTVTLKSLLIPLLSVACVGATQAQAATYTWDAGGGTDTNWTTAANWTTDTVATSNAASNVIISSSAAVTTTSTVDTNNPWSLNSLTFNATTLGNVALSGNRLSFVVNGNNSYTVLDVGGLASGLSVTINNDIFVNNTSTGSNAEVRFNLSSSAAILNLYGKITTTGSNVLTFAANGGVANIYGNFDLGSTGTFRKRDNTIINIYSTGNKYGTLIIGGGGSLNLYAANVLDSTGLINDGGSVLNLNGYNQTIAGFTTGTYGGSITSASAATLTVDTAISSTNTMVVSGSLSLTKAGTGTLLLNKANTYVGNTTVAAGTLLFNSVATGATAQALGKSNTVTIGGASTSGTLQYTGTAAGTLDKNIYAVGNGINSVKNDGAGLLTLSGSLVKNGTILALDGGTSGIKVTGAISGASANSDLYITGGTTTLTNTTNSYNGSTWVYGGGTLVNGVTKALSTTTMLILGGADNSNGTYDLNGYNQVLAGLSGTGTGTQTVTNNGTGASSLFVTGGGTYNGVIADGSAKTALSVNGGNLKLGGVNTYTGTTTVDSGTLTVNGSLATSSAVTVSSGATLAGSGTVGGITAVQGTLAAGDGIGTLKTGNLTLDTGSVLDVELGRNLTLATSDLTNVTGTVDIVSGADLKLTLGTGLSNLVAGDLVFLIENDGADAVQGVFTSLNGVTTTLTDGSLFSWNSQTWEITYKADSATSSFTGGNDIALTVVPEPSTWAMLMGGIGMLAFGQRLRSRRS